MELACQCPAVVVCRCSPTQKADIVKLIKAHTGVRTCAIGMSLYCPFLVVFLIGFNVLSTVRAVRYNSVMS